MENTDNTNIDTSDNDTFSNDIKEEIGSIDNLKKIENAGETKKLIFGFSFIQIFECALCFVIYILIDSFSLEILLGFIVGYIASIVNFLLMIRTLSKAAGSNDDPVKVANITKLSYVGRMFGIGAVIVVFSIMGICDPIALVIPILTTKPTLYIQQFIRKSGDKK